MLILWPLSHMTSAAKGQITAVFSYLQSETLFHVMFLLFCVYHLQSIYDWDLFRSQNPH